MKHDLDQERAPLLEALTRHIGSGYVAFHVPGHKGWRKAPPGLCDLLGDTVALADLTEVGDLDDLQFPRGPIEEAQRLAAEAFGSDEAFFLVNGVTSGIQAAITACACGGRVIAPRNVHRAVIGALAIADARPSYVMPEMDHLTGIAGGLAAAALERALDENPDARAVFLVHPTYYGVAGDIRRLVEITHARGIPVVLDEAHGAHFRFHPGFPPAGMDCQADICVAGCHKTIGAFTQGAVMTVRGSLVDRDILRACLRTVQTTSPSYLLMASLDASRRLMATKGRELLDETLVLSEGARSRINDLGVFKCPGDEWTGKQGFFFLDRTKLTVVTPGYDCHQIERDLRDRFGIMTEFSGLGHLLAVVSYADDAATVDRLVTALQTLGRERRPVNGGALAVDAIHIPEQAIPPRKALFSASEWRDIGKSRDAVSADVVAVYPPGIPMLCPGETVDALTIDLARSFFQRGLHMHGMRVFKGEMQIRVIDGSEVA